MMIINFYVVWRLIFLSFSVIRGRRAIFCVPIPAETEWAKKISKLAFLFYFTAIFFLMLLFLFYYVCIFIDSEFIKNRFVCLIGFFFFLSSPENICYLLLQVIIFLHKLLSLMRLFFLNLIYEYSKGARYETAQVVGDNLQAQPSEDLVCWLYIYIYYRIFP